MHAINLPAVVRLCHRNPPLGGSAIPDGGLRDQPELLGAQDRLDAVAHVELSIQPARVLLHGVWREMELGRDLPVGRASGNQRRAPQLRNFKRIA